MSDFTLWDIARGLLLSARWTIALSLVAFIGGGVVGVLILLLRTGRGRTLPAAARIYIELFQGTPLLMQLFIAFFGLSLLGVDTTPWSAASLALTLWASAFLAEIWRGCVDAVPRGQWKPRRRWRWAICSKCAMSCCRKRCASRSRPPSAFRCK